MNILAVRVGRVGDTVMMTAALSALTRYYPDANITLLTSPAGKHLLKNFHPNIIDLWSWERSGLLKPYIDKASIKQKLHNKHFDKIFCFDTSPHIAELFSNYKGEFHWLQYLTGYKHSAKHYLDFVAESCKKPALALYNTLPVTPDAYRQVEQELKTININPDDSLIMFHPTFSGFSKSIFCKKQSRLRKPWPANR